MELPPNAPRRKSDLYLYQTSEITATLRRIESTVEAKATKSQTPNVKHHDSTGNLVAVLHGIGPEGCSAVSSLMFQIKNSKFASKVNLSEPLIELWEGLPTFHSYIMLNKTP